MVLKKLYKDRSCCCPCACHFHCNCHCHYYWYYNHDSHCRAKDGHWLLPLRQFQSIIGCFCLLDILLGSDKLNTRLFVMFNYETGETSLWSRHCCTMVQNSLNNEYGTSNLTLSHELGSEWLSERTNERSGVCERSKQCGASERVSGASERAGGWEHGPVLTSRLQAYLDHLASWAL